jgi:hypothetical protein
VDPARGGHGISPSYDRRTKTWSQAWIDEGARCTLAGTFADGKWSW